MRKAIHSELHRSLLTLLRETRQRAGLSQQHVADRLGRPQSFVAKYEGGERRLDVLEFISVAEALGVDPVRLFRDFLRRKA
jgi:transcriptional regulator with XRE-family HTH domain